MLQGNMLLAPMRLYSRKRDVSETTAVNCAGALLALSEGTQCNPPRMTDSGGCSVGTNATVTDDDNDDEESLNQCVSLDGEKALYSNILPPVQSFGRALKKPRTLFTKAKTGPQPALTKRPPARKRITSICVPGQSERAPIKPLRAAPILPRFLGKGKIQPISTKF